MRIVPFVLSTVVTVALIILLNNKWGSIPPIGKFLSPQQGFWQNAEPVDMDHNSNFHFKDLKGKATVYIDDRLVPHVFAEHDEDAYFIQGFLHAKNRLWQMDFQTRAAAGRISEILGDKPQYLNYDRQQRRLGMVYGAENTLKAVAQDPLTQLVYDSYTAGVNAYINSLSEGNMPVEYKLLDYKPEQWNNLKIALFIKLMSSDLAGQQYARDIEFTNEKAIYSEAEMNILYPQISDSLIPIIPKGTTFNQPTLTPTRPPGVDSIYFKKDTVVRTPEAPKITDFKGSNSWAVSGSRTRSGNPIIANDPHLRLTFPSIWYEMQITTPTMNVYGVTFPSIPGIVVGFNDHIAWGFTNAGRDIIDYYQVRFKDDSKKEYWFNGNWQPTQLKIETIHIKGRAPYYDTVAYTAFGPVMYDNNFTTGDTTNKTALAVRWIAHDSSNEQMMWIKINRAKNYSNFMEAVKHFSAPAQNIIIASKTGDIAIWQQGKFPARWPGQGLYIMPGEDSSYMWQGYIPNEENPQVLNPAQGFIQSANQRAVDSTYPYFIPGDYFDPRAIAIHNELLQMNSVVPQDMMALQLNNFSTLAEDAVPLLLKYTDVASLPGKKEQEYLKEIKNWDFNLTTDSKAATIFQTWLDSLQVVIFKDEFSQINQPITLPEEQTLIEILIRDSTFRFIDNINTEEKETIQQQITAAFKLAVNDLNKEEARTGLMWGKHKNTSILHLLRESVLPFGKTGLNLPGWRTTINAITKTNGPSWRMVVHLSPETEAYGVYPGGQSGNPGSKYYDNFLNHWVQGKYYTLWMMKASETKDNQIMGTYHFTNG